MSPLEHKTEARSPLQKALTCAEGLSQLVPPLVGIRLMHPNTILTLAGAKGMADIFYLRKEELDDLQAQQSVLAAHDLALRQQPPGLSGEDGGVYIMNRSALATRLQDSHIPGAILPNLDDTDWVRNATNGLHASLAQAREQGFLPPETLIDVLEEGLWLGYPDTAIYDWEESVRRGWDPTPLAHADIVSSHPDAARYAGSMPEFSFRDEHATDPDILATVTRWRSILTDFYNSDWAASRSQDPAWIRAHGELIARGVRARLRWTAERRGLRERPSSSSEF